MFFITFAPHSPHQPLLGPLQVSHILPLHVESCVCCPYSWLWPGISYGGPRNPNLGPPTYKATVYPIEPTKFNPFVLAMVFFHQA